MTTKEYNVTFGTSYGILTGDACEKSFTRLKDACDYYHKTLLEIVTGRLMSFEEQGTTVDLSNREVHLFEIDIDDDGTVSFAKNIEGMSYSHTQWLVDGPFV